MNQAITSVANRLNVRPVTLRITGIMLVILLLIAANASSTKVRTKSEHQLAYETWLKNTEPAFITETDPKLLPILTLKFIGRDEQSTRELKLIPFEDGESKSRVLRILNLAGEAGLFSVKRPAGAAGKPGNVVLTVESPVQNFYTELSEKDLEKNFKAALLLKLFDEFVKVNVPGKLQMTDKSFAEPESDPLPDDTLPEAPVTE